MMCEGLHIYEGMTKVPCQGTRFSAQSAERETRLTEQETNPVWLLCLTLDMVISDLPKKYP